MIRQENKQIEQSRYGQASRCPLSWARLVCAVEIFRTLLHQYSIVQALMSQVETEARTHDAIAIDKIELKICAMTEMAATVPLSSGRTDCTS